MTNTALSTLHEHTTWVEGTQLFAYECGSGEPQLLIHGGLADHHACLPLIPHLSPEGRCIMPDLRASGRSHFRGELSWRRWADDLCALLDDLGIASCNVAGTSMGSGVALMFALSHPARVRHLQLIQPLFRGTALGHPQAISDAFTTMNRAAQQARTHGIDALLSLYSALPDALRTRAIAMARRFDIESVATTTEFLASGAQPFDELRELAALSMPCIVVPGTDPQHPSYVADSYLQNIPYSRSTSSPAIFSDT